jgi:hypothetical protein
LTLASATHHAPPPNRSYKAGGAASSRPDDPGRTQVVGVVVGRSAQHELAVDRVDRDGVSSAISPSRTFIASLSASSR